MGHIKRIAVIYNPNSTSDSLRQAELFKRRINRRLAIPTEIIPTKSAGHAEKIAKEFADKNPHTMVVSSSGDGGFHEVVNGVLSSKHPTTTVGLLPGGNANDHYHSMHKRNVFKRIRDNSADPIDALKITSDAGWSRYGHSYIGLGMTAQINDILTNHRKRFNPFKEVVLVVINVFKVRSVIINVDGHTKRLDNLVFLNASRMSKILKNGSQSSMADGKFEVVELKSGAFLQLVRYFFRAVTIGFDNAWSYDTYQLHCLHDVTIQIDGEQYSAKSGETLTISSEHLALNEII